MFTCREMTYVQLHKTACTHIAEILSRTFKGRLIGKHNRPIDADLYLGRYFVSSIRNPWDWYVSLWAYGVEGRGWVRGRLTNQRSRNASDWRRAYTRADDAPAFRRWLQMLHDPGLAWQVGEGFGESGMSTQCGLFTYRYLRLCCLEPPLLCSAGPAPVVQDLCGFDRENCYIDHFIRMEFLEDDLIEVIGRVRPLSADEIAMIRGAGRTNTSSRPLSLGEYYDDHSIEIVRRRDKLIVEKFGYTPPVRTSDSPARHEPASSHRSHT